MTIELFRSGWGWKYQLLTTKYPLSRSRRPHWFATALLCGVVAALYWHAFSIRHKRWVRWDEK